MNNTFQLPAELQRAQDAVMLPEVQEMMKQLAKYNLGICMPHLHTKTEDFAILPDNVVQVERNLRVDFESTDQSNSSSSVPVAWRWIGDRVVASSKCKPTTGQNHIST